MSPTRMFRRACGPAAVAVTAVLCAASPAHADVTVSPTSAYQTAGVNLTFKVVNDSVSAAITAVRLSMPPASPVAEVYPLSVPEWAPSLTNRTLNPPMPNPHGSDPIRQTTDTILWTAMPGKAIPPGGTSSVKVAMGPLPESERMQFTLQATYAGGAVGPALSPVSITLAVPPPAPVASDEPLPPEVAAILAENDQDTGLWTIIGWLAVLLGVAVGVALWVRSRRTAPSGDGPATADTDATRGDTAGGNTAGDGRSRVSAWSYRDRS